MQIMQSIARGNSTHAAMAPGEISAEALGSADMVALAPSARNIL
jgi:hypothetical protein